MFRSFYVNHSISAISHFYSEDLPTPFSNCNFYIDVIRNLFHSKTSSEIVKLGLVYDFTKDKGYMSVNVTPKPYVKINSLIDVKRFISWFNEHFNELLFNYENVTDTKKTTTYAYNDGYIRYAVVVTESLNNQPDQITIEYSIRG